MVLCFQEEFKLFYTIVPAPSNRHTSNAYRYSSPHQTHKPFSLALYLLAKEEREFRSFLKSRSPRWQQNILLCPYTCCNPPWGERKSRKQVAVYMRKWRRTAKNVICCSYRKRIQSVSEFPEIYLSSNFTSGLNKWYVICDLVVWNVKSEEKLFLRTEIKQMCLRKRDQFRLYHPEKAETLALEQVLNISLKPATAEY